MATKELASTSKAQYKSHSPPSIKAFPSLRGKPTLCRRRKSTLILPHLQGKRALSRQSLPIQQMRLALQIDPAAEIGFAPNPIHSAVLALAPQHQHQTSIGHCPPIMPSHVHPHLRISPRAVLPPPVFQTATTSLISQTHQGPPTYLAMARVLSALRNILPPSNATFAQNDSLVPTIYDHICAPIPTSDHSFAASAERHLRVSTIVRGTKDSTLARRSLSAVVF